MRFAVVIEKADKNYSAYLPDVPGCITTGKTVQETLSNMREALSLHFEGMHEDAEPIPDPTTLVDYIELDIASSPESRRGKQRQSKGNVGSVKLRGRTSADNTFARK